MNKQDKIGYLVRAFERQGLQREEGETDLQFAKRVVDGQVATMRLNFLRQQIQAQMSIENPPTQLDVSDL